MEVFILGIPPWQYSARGAPTAQGLRDGAMGPERQDGPVHALKWTSIGDILSIKEGP
jgi:hypothetical protein